MGFAEDIKWFRENRKTYEQKVQEIFGVKPDPHVVIGSPMCIRDSVIYSFYKKLKIPRALIEDLKYLASEISMAIPDYNLIIFNPLSSLNIVKDASRDGYNLIYRNEMMRCYLEEYSHICDSILHNLPTPLPYVKLPGEKIDWRKVKEKAIADAKVEARAQAVIYRACDFEDNKEKLFWRDFAIDKKIRKFKRDLFLTGELPELKEFYSLLLLTFMQYRLKTLLNMNKVEFLKHISSNNPTHLSREDWVEAETIWEIYGIG